MPIAFITTVLLVLASSSLHRHSGVPVVVTAGILLVFAAVTFLAGKQLNERYMRDRAEQLRGSGGPHDFSAPAIPRWVVHLEDVAFGAAMAAVLPYVEAWAP